MHNWNSDIRFYNWYQYYKEIFHNYNIAIYLTIIQNTSIIYALSNLNTYEVIHKWCHGLRGRGQRCCDNSTKALVIKSVTIWGRGSNIAQNWVTPFMNEPYMNKLLFYVALTIVETAWSRLKISFFSSSLKFFSNPGFDRLKKRLDF